MWINPPIVVEVTIPSAHNTTSTKINVHNIFLFLLIDLNYSKIKLNTIWCSSILRSLQKRFLLLQTTDYCFKTVSYIGLIYGLIRSWEILWNFAYPIPAEVVSNPVVPAHLLVSMYFTFYLQVGRQACREWNWLRYLTLTIGTSEEYITGDDCMNFFFVAIKSPKGWHDHRLFRYWKVKPWKGDMMRCEICCCIFNVSKYERNKAEQSHPFGVSMI